MKDLATALCLFVVGFVVLATFGGTYLKDRRHPDAVSISSASPPSRGVPREEAPAERPEVSVSVSEYAQSCAAFDPIAHPEQALDILEYASGVTGVPVDVLDSVWRNETGFVYGSGTADTCDVMEQLDIRCKVGGSCGHRDAMQAMGDRFGWDLKNLRCSCGSATMEDNTHYFGGCCGPFQFSGAEIDDLALTYGLDPMTFCGGAVIAAMELKKHHDHALKKGYAQWWAENSEPPMSTDNGAWKWAIKRYFGTDAKGKYWAHALEHWQEFHAWVEQDLRQPGTLRKKLAGQVQWSVNKMRKMGTLPVASN